MQAPKPVQLPPEYTKRELGLSGEDTLVAEN